MTRLYVFGIVVLLVIAGCSVFPARAAGTQRQAQASRACKFRSAAWGVVQETSYIVNTATGYGPVDVQHETDAQNEKLTHISIRYRYPAGAQTLQDDLISAWTYAYSASQDNQNMLNDISDDVLFQQDQQEMADDTQSAWEAENNAWSDVKGICAR